MCHDAEDYEARAGECERLAYKTKDPLLREQILSLARIYLDYAGHLRGRTDGGLAGWPEAVNQ